MTTKRMGPHTTHAPTATPAPNDKPTRWPRSNCTADEASAQTRQAFQHSKVLKRFEVEWAQVQATARERGIEALLSVTHRIGSVWSSVLYRQFPYLRSYLTRVRTSFLSTPGLKCMAVLSCAAASASASAISRPSSGQVRCSPSPVQSSPVQSILAIRGESKHDTSSSTEMSRLGSALSSWAPQLPPLDLSSLCLSFLDSPSSQARARATHRVTRAATQRSCVLSLLQPTSNLLECILFRSPDDSLLE